MTQHIEYESYRDWLVNRRERIFNNRFDNSDNEEYEDE